MEEKRPQIENHNLSRFWTFFSIIFFFRVIFCTLKSVSIHNSGYSSLFLSLPFPLCFPYSFRIIFAMRPAFVCAQVFVFVGFQGRLLYDTIITLHTHTLISPYNKITLNTRHVYDNNNNNKNKK